jgi:transposase InsO family protein
MFESHIFQELCKLLGIEKTRMTPYRPQSDGMIERANHTIENMSAFVDKNQKNWDELVPLLMLAYRSSVHESTGISPNEMVFGRQVTLPIDLVLGRTDPERNGISDYIRNLSEKIDKVHSFARNNLELNSQNIYCLLL